MEARKVIAKIIVGIMAAACYQPEPRPETAADWTVTRVFAGQQDGQVTLSWADPAVNGLEGIEIRVSDLSKKIIRETKVQAGVQTAVFGDLPKGQTYGFALSGFGTGSRQNQTVIYLTVSTVKAFFTRGDVRDLTADLSWETENLLPGTKVTLETDKITGLPETVGSSATVNISPGTDYTFCLTADDGSGNGETIAVFRDRSLLFWDDFDETGSTDGPNPEKWSNPYIDLEGSGSAWNNALVEDWSMVDFLKEGETTFIRFKGSKENGKAGASGVQSKNHFYFTFGKIEFRARLKENNPQGHFAALWLMPQISGRPDGLFWPMGGEIDVMEHVRRNSRISQTVHTEKTSAAPFFAGDPVYINAEGKTSSIGSYKDWEEWHVFAVEWTENGLFWYLDGKHTRTYNKNMTDPAWYPFTKDSAFYIIMNMGVGRSTDAYPGGAGDGFYAHMDVDYVKVTANNDTVLRDCPYYK